MLTTSALLTAAPAVTQEAPPRPSYSQADTKVDPTENVKALNAAEAKRQDDLRLQQEKYFDAKLKDLDEISALREKTNAQLRDSEIVRIDSEMKLRAEFNEKLQIAEAHRIDAIRAVDVNAVTVASQRASDQALALQKKGDDSALVLSAQVTKSADDVRTLVKTTADEQSRNLQQQFAAIQVQFTGLATRLSTLEQTGSESLGKSKYADPALAALVTEVQKLSRTQQDTAGQGTGRSDLTGWIVGGVMLLLALGTFAMLAFRSRPQPQRVEEYYEPRVQRPSPRRAATTSEE
jgi:hypothetical protein